MTFRPAAAVSDSVTCLRAGSNAPPGYYLEITAMETIVRDPVCGELFDWEKAATVLSYQGTLHYFCSIRCSKRFLHAPTRFILSIQVLLGVPQPPLLAGVRHFLSCSNAKGSQ